MTCLFFFRSQNLNNIIHLYVHCDIFFKHITYVKRPNVQSLPSYNFVYLLIYLYFIFLFPNVYLYFMSSCILLPSLVLYALSHFSRSGVCSPTHVH
jgi:hypothetical protein